MKRNRKNLNLPKYVYEEKGIYYLRAYDPNTKKKGKRIPLGKSGEPLSGIYLKYEQAMSEEAPQTLEYGISLYLESRDFTTLSEYSIRDGLQYSKSIINTAFTNGETFGNLQLGAITTGLVQKYHDKRSEQYPVAANHEIGFLSTVFNWLKRRDIINKNPAQGVKKNKIEPRDRYVTDDEFFTALQLAAEGPSYLKPMMMLAYVCRARRIEIREFRKSHLTDEGLLLQRRKGSKTQIIEFTPMLKEALKLSKTKEQINSVWLIHNSKGQQITDYAFKSAWRRLMKKYRALGFESFHFHDLKAKGVSDFKGDKLLASGHKTQSMLNVYDRKIEKVKATR